MAQVKRKTVRFAAIDDRNIDIDTDTDIDISALSSSLPVTTGVKNFSELRSTSSTPLNTVSLCAHDLHPDSSRISSEQCSSPSATGCKLKSVNLTLSTNTQTEDYLQSDKTGSRISTFSTDAADLTETVTDRQSPVMSRVSSAKGKQSRHFIADGTSPEEKADSSVNSSITDTADDFARNMELTSSVDEESGIKIRYIHVNDRVYAVGGVRSENRLQWYAVRGSGLNSKSDGAELNIYKIGREVEFNPDESRVPNMPGEMRRSDSSELHLLSGLINGMQQKEGLNHTAGNETSQSAEEYDKREGQQMWSDFLQELHQKKDKLEDDAVPGCEVTSSCLTNNSDKDKLESQRLWSELIGEVEQKVGRSSPVGSTQQGSLFLLAANSQRIKDRSVSERQTDSRATEASVDSCRMSRSQFEDGLAHLRSLYEGQLATSRAEVERLKTSQKNLLEQLTRSQKETAELNKRLEHTVDLESTNTSYHNTAAAVEDSSHLQQALASRDEELTSLRSQLSAVHQRVDDLEHRYRSISVNGNFTAGRPYGTPTGEKHIGFSELPATPKAIGPIVKSYSPHQPVGPIRCRSAPVNSSKPPGSTNRVSAKKPLGTGRDYFEHMFDDLRGEIKVNQSMPSAFAVSHQYNTCTASSTADIRILEVSPDGRYVRIINMSDSQEYELGGHGLQQNIQGHLVHVFRFPMRLNVPKLGAVTVWSDAGGRSASPRLEPFSLTFRGLGRWIYGSHCTTILCRPDGQATAWWTPASKTCRDPIFNDTLRAVTSPTTLNMDCTSAKLADNNTAFDGASWSTMLNRREQGTPPVLKLAFDPVSADVQEVMPNGNTPLKPPVSFHEIEHIAEIPGAGAPAQRLGSATLRKYHPSVKIQPATFHRTVPC